MGDWLRVNGTLCVEAYEYMKRESRSQHVYEDVKATESDIKKLIEEGWGNCCSRTLDADIKVVPIPTEPEVEVLYDDMTGERRPNKVIRYGGVFRFALYAYDRRSLLPAGRRFVQYLKARFKLDGIDFYNFTKLLITQDSSSEFFVFMDDKFTKHKIEEK